MYLGFLYCSLPELSRGAFFIVHTMDWLLLDPDNFGYMFFSLFAFIQIDVYPWALQFVMIAIIAFRLVVGSLLLSHIIRKIPYLSLVTFER